MHPERRIGSVPLGLSRLEQRNRMPKLPSRRQPDKQTVPRAEDRTKHPLLVLGPVVSSILLALAALIGAIAQLAMIFR